MRLWVLYSTVLLCVIFFAGCGSSHKLSSVEYTDLGQGSAGFVHPEFPAELADSLGWGSLASSEYDKVKEEFRIAISSESYPFHLFRIQSGRRIKGESILYWPKAGTVDVFNVPTNMADYLKGTCDEIRQTQNFEYCFPILTNEIDWGVAYDNLERNNIWTLPDISAMDIEASEDRSGWTIHTQVRLGDYYRSFHHISPDQYGGSAEALNILAVSSQLRIITSSFSLPQNFNTYQGITSGVRGAEFVLCDNSEVWRFNADLSELLTENGYPTISQGQDSLLFFVDVKATVRDEWYAQRANGFSKVITPSEVNSFSMVSTTTCPSLGAFE
ncbi:MAG: hypothetical protein MI700_13780 [Balneolales bacterium]|nr:hypothetical protein [Balneolales bacterium]